MSSIINAKYFKITFFLLILAEILSYLGWAHPIINTICFVVIILAMLILCLKKLEWGIYILLAELFIGSKSGAMFSLNSGDINLSVRMGIFVVVTGVWLMHELMRIIKRIDANKILALDWNYKVCHSRASGNPKIKSNAVFHEIPACAGMTKKTGMAKNIILFGIVLCWAFVWGIIRSNDFGNVFLDFNNWLYFLVALPLTRIYTNENTNKHKFIKNIISILSATAVIIFLKTIFLFYIFTHSFAFIGSDIYKWVRDTGVGEITNMAGGFYRVFMQAQIYSLILFFIILFCHSCESRNPEKNNLKFLDPDLRQDDKINKHNKKNFILLITYYLLLITTFTVIILSFSRSFWVAFIITLLFYYFIILFFKLPITHYPLPIIFHSFAKLFFIATISLGLVIFILYLPPKISNLNLIAVFGQRATQGEAASNSRVNQLKPLLLAITKHPLIGSGFGTTVTYKSNDPRIVNETAGQSGLVTTYAFEWGYLDMILKFGLVGLVIYLIIIFKILGRLLKLKTASWRTKLKINSNNQIQNNNFLDPDFRRDDKKEEDNNKENYGLQITDYRLQMVFFLALIALLVVNIFSPYLNHPLGIGFLILSFVLILK
ncbi:hypothetical protein COU23_02835 [Candidatus Kuenenbacteria bacterium CG10_big_fil_rev_8_21_14_0_10_36_11]|uniref:O-antigen ligase-related domain-containing protein n=1 Tax=Candidatus Kuenenbacteria bacterium CG10_big_fil_rev_8_21_14_0_10_36_11 TaxID=1974618 RepID=A0A2M6WA73_9BACT|nr:MAG: hypothetical protein COU23_02835 [Candidatus Kuenenbacteria bacterium CG10_big_fil_rev_8_21_14_0_10_36_11]